MIQKTKNEEFLDKYLADFSVEELLEYFDVSVLDMFDTLFENGLIDEELIDEFL